jgi:hypothetical protein
VITLANRARPTDSVSISYYQYPSWGATQPPSPQSQLILTEKRMQPSQPAAQSVAYGTPIRLLAQGGLYVGPLISNVQYYPTATTDSPVALEIFGGTGVIRHGDQVQIRTTEWAAGNYNMLGAWSTPSLYYSTPGSPNEVWTVQKRDPTQPEVHYGDDISFVSNAYAGQLLQPYFTKLWGNVYLTTKSGDPYYWTARPVVPASVPFQRWIIESGTAIPTTTDFGGWALADYDGDNVVDLFGIKTKNTGSGNVVVQVLSGASSYRSSLLPDRLPDLCGRRAGLRRMDGGRLGPRHHSRPVRD